MKKLITRVLLLFFFATVLPFAAASQNSNKSWTPDFVTLNSPGAGHLKLTKEALSASNLRITGDIDARDFKTLKEATISRTRVLDLSDANIKAYTGKEGCVTYKGSNWIVPAAKDYVYKANTFPINAFNERRDNSLNTWTAGSTSLCKIILPKTLEAFEPDAFYDNNNLTERCDIFVRRAETPCRRTGIYRTSRHSGHSTVRRFMCPCLRTPCKFVLSYSHSAGYVG